MGPGFFVIALVLYILGFAFFTYACIVADPDTSPTAQFLTQRVPNYVGNKLQSLLGPKMMDYLKILTDHALQLMYLVIVLGCWSIMFSHGYAWISDTDYISHLHMYMGYFVFIVCMSSFRYACNVSPGFITELSLAKFDHYPYDNLLFVPNRICPTVGIRRLARSKYDRFSERHVARFDHYCAWLNQPIGEENYRYFLLFLLVHVLMCGYGTIMTAYLFRGEIREKDLLNVTFFDVATGREVQADLSIIWQYMFRRHFYMAGVLLLMGVMTVVLTAFLCFHVWIGSKGMTTNEYYKWQQVKKWHKQETKRYQQAVKAGIMSADNPKIATSEPSVTDGDVGCVGPVPVASKSESSHDDSEADDNPIIDPGPMPKNMYDLGFVENWREVFSPRSLRKDAIDRWTKSLQSRKATEANVAVPAKPKVS